MRGYYIFKAKSDAARKKLGDLYIPYLLFLCETDFEEPTRLKALPDRAKNELIKMVGETIATLEDWDFTYNRTDLHKNC
jgi:hypothetical protein